MSSQWSWDNFWKCPECKNYINNVHEECPFKCGTTKSISSIKTDKEKTGIQHSGGKRADLGGLYVRSSWEANYARYLNWLQKNGEIECWEYEPDTYEFPVKRGNRSYTPDFKIFYSDGTYEYHEVKGYMNSHSAVKLKRMAKYYPDEKLILIDSEVYKALAKDMRLIIKNWE